jgi:hypothetical protein
MLTPSTWKGVLLGCFSKFIMDSDNKSEWFEVSVECFTGEKM